MIDSSLIYMTELLPADAAKALRSMLGSKCTMSWSESSAVSVHTWPPDVTICPSVCRAECCVVSTFLQSATGNTRARCISPSICLRSSLIFSSIPRESLHVYLYVQQLSQLHFFFSFSAFQSLAEEMLFTHTFDVLHLSQPAWQPLTIIKYISTSTPHDDTRRCYLPPKLSSVTTPTDVFSCYLPYRRWILVWDRCNCSPVQM